MRHWCIVVIIDEMHALMMTSTAVEKLWEVIEQKYDFLPLGINTKSDVIDDA